MVKAFNTGVLEIRRGVFHPSFRPFLHSTPSVHPAIPLNEMRGKRRRSLTKFISLGTFPPRSFSPFDAKPTLPLALSFRPQTWLRVSTACGLHCLLKSGKIEKADALLTRFQTELTRRKTWALRFLLFDTFFYTSKQNHCFLPQRPRGIYLNNSWGYLENRSSTHRSSLVECFPMAELLEQYLPIFLSLLFALRLPWLAEVSQVHYSSRNSVHVRVPESPLQLLARV